MPQYISPRQDPFSLATDAMQQDWSQKYMYAFPPFNMVGQVLKKTQEDRCQLLIITRVWVTQPWYPPCQMSIEHPVWIPNKMDLLKNPQGEHHPLLLNAYLTLVASKKGWSTISNARSGGTKSNYESAWTKFNSWCGRRKINPFHSPIQSVLDFLADLFDQTGLARLY